MTLEEYMDVPFNVRSVFLDGIEYFAINIVIGDCPKRLTNNRVYLPIHQYVRMGRYIFKTPQDWWDYQDSMFNE